MPGRCDRLRDDFLAFWFGEPLDRIGRGRDRRSMSTLTLLLVFASQAAAASPDVDAATQAGADEPAAAVAEVDALSPVAAGRGAGENGMAFVALAIGMLIVLGLILGFKANAFLALILAAIAVSLIAPDDGEFATRIARVAESFGSAAGKIAILIAAAAIIGKCLMESGAADRIVQSAVSITGEKRAPWALMGSGFVLSVPVFFDTVFYLLVPLARSLYRRTERNYLLYLCAIAAGGAITHTLVPPTPGPLLMTANLGVGIPTMIGVGALVALPAAVVGVIASVWLDRRFPVPFREVASTDELADADGPWEAAEAGGRPLPGLGLSLLPVLLPVALIAVDTAFGTLADWERQRAITAMPAAEQSAYQGTTAAATTLREALPTRFDGARQMTAVIGNPNFALLFAALLSMWLVFRQCKLSLSELGSKVESALESGGVIILITAAGGAFGGMLKVAGVGDAIQSIAREQQATGLVMLVLAWAIAAVMKIAQGSSTTAMIVVSGIFGGALSDVSTLGFHPVYLATAIGAGSLMGSWMNDSGFWIFTKMGGLTERESLKSWTILLAVLSITALVATLILASVLPLN